MITYPTHYIHQKADALGVITQSQLLDLAVEVLKEERRDGEDIPACHGLCNALWLASRNAPLAVRWQAESLRKKLVRRIQKDLGKHAYIHSWLIAKGYADADAFDTKAGRRKLNKFRIQWAKSLAEEYRQKGK